MNICIQKIFHEYEANPIPTFERSESWESFILYCTS